MSRAVYVMRNGELVEKHLASPHPKAGHFIISDNLADVYNPATKKRYSSKSQYYRDTRAAGCEIVGNDQPVKGPPSARERLRESIPATINRIYQQNGWE